MSELDRRVGAGEVGPARPDLVGESLFVQVIIFTDPFEGHVLPIFYRSSSLSVGKIDAAGGQRLGLVGKGIKKVDAADLRVT